MQILFDTWFASGHGTLETSSKVKKIAAWKECFICYYWCFFDKGLKFQPDVCYRCHDILMMYIAILNIRCVDYCCIIKGITKSEAINLLQNIDLNEKSGTL